MITLWQHGHLRETRGFPPHDRPWFGFIGDVLFSLSNIGLTDPSCLEETTDRHVLLLGEG